VSLGFYGLIPNAGFTAMSSSYPDEREQYFSNSLHAELYGDRLKPISMAFASGLRLTDSLSIGLGATLGFRALADAPVFVADAGSLQDVQINTNVDATVSLIPHGGISWRIARRLHLTGTLHAPQKFEIEAGFKYLLATGIEQGSKLRFVYAYMPWQAGSGLAWNFLRWGSASWTVSGSVLYARWSQYIDRHAERPLSAYPWADTLSGTAGLSCDYDTLSLALDGQYKPTPVPLQTGRTNYVDNDRAGLSMSVRYRFRWLDTDLALGAQLQGFRMIERHQSKLKTPTNAKGENRTPELVADEVPDDALISRKPVAGREGLQTNNPGWPGFSSMGWVTSAGLYLSVGL